jgi:hypothetical protein
MANKKISQLTLAVDVIYPIDLMEVARDDGAGGYTSEAITGDYIYGGMMVASPYLSAYNDINQTFLAATAKAVEFKQIEFQNYIDVPSPTTLTVDKSGFYKVDFTGTIWNDGGGSPTSYHIGFFLKKNGTNIPNSSKFMMPPENNHVESYSTSWLVELKGGDYIEIYCVMDKTNFKLLTEAAQTGVVTPSSSVIMSRIG